MCVTLDMNAWPNHTAAGAVPPNAAESIAVFEALGSSIRGSYKFTIKDGYYHIPGFYVLFYPDGSCVAYGGTFGNGKIDFAKDEYVLWVPQRTIDILRANDPLIPITYLRHANLKPFEERVSDKTEEIKRMLLEIKRNLEVACARLGV